MLQPLFSLSKNQKKRIAKLSTHKPERAFSLEPKVSDTQECIGLTWLYIMVIDFCTPPYLRTGLSSSYYKNPLPAARYFILASWVVASRQGLWIMSPIASSDPYSALSSMGNLTFPLCCAFVPRALYPGHALGQCACPIALSRYMHDLQMAHGYPFLQP